MIDTATIVATAAIMDEDKLVAESIVNYKKKHSEKLLPTIDHMLGDSGLTLREMDAFGVVAGPGSFTGLRIGMATAKGFAQALDKPMVTVSTLESLAANVACADGVICPMLDAQRSQVYTGVYRWAGDDLQAIQTETVLTIEELAKILNTLGDGPKYILGDALPKYYESLARMAGGTRRVAPYLAMDRASSAAQIAIKKLLVGQTVTYKDAALTYLRKSSAEERFGK